MSIFFHKEDREIPNIDQKRIVSAIKDFCLRYGKTIGYINFIYCSDEYLLEMNKKYLDHDYFTDVITFDYSEDKIVSGDIFISIDRVEANARDLAISFDEELNRVMIHGVLHLIGFNDKSDEEKQQMREKEDTCLSLR